MDARKETAARVAEIAPFHVMEVQTAARALEAAGRTVIHMEIGEPDFPTPEPVIAAAQRAIAGGGMFYTSALGLPDLRTAHRGPLRRSLRRRGRAGAHHRHGRLVGRAAARPRVDRRPRRAHSAAGPGVSLQSPFRPRPRRRSRGHSRRAGIALPAHRGDDRAPLDAGHARRARSPRHRIRRAPSCRATRCADRVGDRCARRPSHRRRDLPRPHLRSRYRERPRSVLEFAARRFRHLELLQILQHDRLAPGLGGCAGAPRARSREARAEPLHFAGRAVAARGARVLCARDARDPRVAPSRVRGTARLPRARIARAGLSASPSCRPAVSSSMPTARRSRATASNSAATCSRAPASRSRRASTSAVIARSEHVRFAYTISMEKLQDGVARLAAFLAHVGLDGTHASTDTPVRRFVAALCWRCRRRLQRLRNRRLLLAGRVRPARHPCAREADRRRHQRGRRCGADAAARARAGDPRLCQPGTGVAGQPQLYALQRPRAPFVVWNVFATPRFRSRRGNGAFRSPAASAIAVISTRPTRARKPRGSPPRARTSTSAACPRIRRSASSTIRCSRRSSAGPKPSLRDSCSTSSRTRSCT